MKEIDFNRRDDYYKACEGFHNLDEFGALHITVSDGNVDDGCIEFCRTQPEVLEHELVFLDLLQSLPYGMRYAAYLEGSSTNYATPN